AAPPTTTTTADAAPPGELTDAQLAAASEAQATNEVIVVTGSTIERRAFTTPAPVTVVDRAALAAAGTTTVGGTLQALPAQSNGGNAQFNNGGDGSTRINLRGLGASRTLTLINGRRVVPGGIGADSSVDINSIPLAMIERVEVLKDGASAVYGSDAIGGVVNIISRTDLDGSEATAYTGTSQRGDGLTYDLSFATGMKSAKGHLMVSGGYQDQRPVFAADRAFSREPLAYDYKQRAELFGGSTTTPQGRINARAIDADHDGHPDPGYVLCGTQADGTPIQYCTPDGKGGFRPFDSEADLYNFRPETYLYTPSTRYNLYALGDYQLHPRARAFFEASYQNRKSDQQLASETFVDDATISADSIYNPLDADILGYRRRLFEFGRRRTRQNIDTFRGVVGFDGTAPEPLTDWKWELSFNYGRTEASQQLSGGINRARLAAALGPSFLDAAHDNAPTCGTPSAPIAGCVPVNLLAGAAAHAVTRDMIDYVTFTGTGNGYNEQQTALATAHGPLLETPWGGDVSMAIGVDHRREAGGSTPDPLTAAGEAIGDAAQATGGRYHVTEGFVELSAVPVVGKGWAQWVELDAAARAFDYSNFGGGATWKLGGLFRTRGGVSVRGTFSTAFRAPSISELYAGRHDDSPLATDPCDTTPAGSTAPITLDPAVATRCAKQGVPAGASYGNSQLRAVLGGNPKLTAETAQVGTVGVVIEPPQVPGLSLTADYFHVDIDDAIQAAGASVILSNCYRRGLDSFCDQVVRNPLLDGKIDHVDDLFQNIGRVSTSGIDGAVGFTRATPYGRLHAQLDATYLLSYKLDNSRDVLDGRGVYDFGVYAPVKAVMNAAWSRDGVGAGLNLRFISGFDECENNDCNSFAPGADRDAHTHHVAANAVADIYASYAFHAVTGTTTITAGINNVTDSTPPTIYNGFANSDPATYDYMGRFFYTRITQQF
ncbi:MAG TPA: TonB-dependent receptor, partial [Kofleriaceae bacterium]|nr:TonB-dependent receptor [Kofleriaceae bacterium]